MIFLISESSSLQNKDPGDHQHQDVDNAKYKEAGGDTKVVINQSGKMGREEDTGKVAESAGCIHASLQIEWCIVNLHHVLILNMKHFGQGQAGVLQGIKYQDRYCHIKLNLGFR